MLAQKAFLHHPLGSRKVYNRKNSTGGLTSCITTIIVPCVAHFDSSNTDEHIGASKTIGNSH